MQGVAQLVEHVTYLSITLPRKSVDQRSYFDLLNPWSWVRIPPPCQNKLILYIIKNNKINIPERSDKYTDLIPYHRRKNIVVEEKVEKEEEKKEKDTKK